MYTGVLILLSDCHSQLLALLRPDTGHRSLTVFIDMLVRHVCLCRYVSQTCLFIQFCFSFFPDSSAHAGMLSVAQPLLEARLFSLRYFSLRTQSASD